MPKIQQNFRQTKTYTKLPYSRAPSPVPLSKNIAASNTLHTTAIQQYTLPKYNVLTPCPPPLSPPPLLISCSQCAGRAGGQDPPFKAERLTKAARRRPNLHASIDAPVDDTTRIYTIYIYTQVYVYIYTSHIYTIILYIAYYYY